ncbi:MAG: DUF3488 and DUF4129 domain-containing transglutaminase family protein [Sandaracinaceae bacterium]
MSFARLHKVVSYLFAALGLFAIGAGGYLPIASQVVIALAAAGSWFVEGPRLRDPRWTRGWTVALFLLIAIQVARGFLTDAEILPLALEFTGALQVSRLYNRRTAREYQQIGAIALLQLVAATVLSTDLDYAVAFLGFLVVTPWMLSLSHLRDELEAHSPAEGEERERTIARALESKDLVGAGYLATSAGLVVPLFLLTGFLFVVFPRVGLGFLSFGRNNAQTVSGFGSGVELGNFGVIRTDATVILRVTPPGLPSPPPPTASLRMRGTSFDHYDGWRWTRTNDLEAEGIGRVGTHYPVPVRMPRPLTDAAWQIMLEPLEELVVFLPPDAVGIRLPPRITGGVEVGRELTAGPGVDLRYGDADGLGLRYTAYTSPDAHEHDQLYDGEDQLYLQLPEDHEHVIALAEEWTADATTDQERVAALLSHLRDSGEFTYSLEMPRVADDEVPLDVFLFRARRAHCEYYSTAMAVMLRAVGIPSRNVTGFLGGRYNEYGSYYALSQGDAHSWVEAFYDGRWRTLDPTPADRDAIGPDSGWFGALAQILDAVRERWADDIVAYDLRSQVELFRTLRHWFGREADDGVDERSPTVGAESGERAPTRWGTPVAFVLLVLTAIALVVWRLRRRRGQARGTLTEREATRLYRRLDRALSKAGHPRRPDESPEERVAQLERIGFPQLDVVRRITERYLRARFGGLPIPKDELSRLQRELGALRSRA